MPERARQLTRRYIVRGRVQGVGFRWFVEKEASDIGVIGWVRNNDDGTVEILATGTSQQLTELHRCLREGPRASRVDEVEVSEAQPVEGLKAFGIEGAF
jgi:acylphosphatase